jgi:hypothetical protein
MRRLLIAPFLIAAACDAAVVEEPIDEAPAPQAEVELLAHVEVEYTFDPSCGRPAPAALAAAVELWAQWGVTITEGDGVELCVMDREPREGLAGWTGDGRLELAWYAADQVLVIAHELGHVVLRGNEHLPAGAIGIMAPEMEWQPDAFAWTEADAELLAAHDLAR